MLDLMKCCAFTCVFFISIALSYQTCVQNYELRNWEFDDHSSPPANLTQSLTYGNSTIIEVWLKDKREDFDLTLFANPFVKNEADCPSRLEEHENLRQFFRTCTVLQNQNQSVSIPFGSIFTGCYYFVMTNKAGNNWRLNPVYYKTSNLYHNTKLEVVTEVAAKPADMNKSIELRAKLKIPLDCLKVHAELYELETEIDDPITDINYWRIPLSQECEFSKIKGEVLIRCGTSPLITNLTLDVQILDKKNEEWTALVIWKELRPGGGQYYLHFAPRMVACYNRYRSHSIDTWRPLVQEIWVPYGRVTADNNPHSRPISDGFFAIVCAGILLAISTSIILIYWILRIRKLAIKKIRGKHEYSEAPQVSVSVYGGKESNEILLLYERGSHEFMTKMHCFGEALQKHCSGYRVHDVYAINEWKRVSELGAAGWVEELLKNGSKIVWVDTPEFRSLFNDTKKRPTARDFRDDAIIYAVRVATDLFQNAVTQYRRHFVVRVKGYEVQNQDNDPLKVVSPHARYRIPEQFSLLCEQLRAPMKSLETTGDEEMGI